MEPLLRLLPGPLSVGVRYGATVAMVLLTFALRAGIEQGAGTYGFILFIPAIVAASLLFDRGSGFLALALSAGLVGATLAWSGSENVHIAALAGFLIVGGGLVFVSEGLHRALERAHKAEREKDLLLQEMSHRVKNKFAMITSIISLQAREAKPEARAELETIASRVRVIADVHDYLQLSRHDGHVDMAEYLRVLCGSLGQVLGNLRPVTVAVTSDQIMLPPEKALSAGLIVNELVTNAFKYAFPDDGPGSIHVRLARSGRQVELSITDSGVGCAEKAPAGLGKKLVTLLMAQLGGSAKWEAANPGCRVSGAFPAT
jgi:two-component sensor histidine kinase